MIVIEQTDHQLWGYSGKPGPNQARKAAFSGPCDEPRPLWLLRNDCVRLYMFLMLRVYFNFKISVHTNIKAMSSKNEVVLYQSPVYL